MGVKKSYPKVSTLDKKKIRALCVDQGGRNKAAELIGVSVKSLSDWQRPGAVWNRTSRQSVRDAWEVVFADKPMPPEACVKKSGFLITEEDKDKVALLVQSSGGFLPLAATLGCSPNAIRNWVTSRSARWTAASRNMIHRAWEERQPAKSVAAKPVNGATLKPERVSSTMTVACSHCDGTGTMAVTIAELQAMLENGTLKLVPGGGL